MEKWNTIDRKLSMIEFFPRLCKEFCDLLNVYVNSCNRFLLCLRLCNCTIHCSPSSLFESNVWMYETLKSELVLKNVIDYVKDDWKLYLIRRWQWLLPQARCWTFRCLHPLETHNHIEDTKLKSWGSSAHNFNPSTLTHEHNHFSSESYVTFVDHLTSYTFNP